MADRIADAQSVSWRHARVRFVCATGLAGGMMYAWRAARREQRNRYGRRRFTPGTACAVGDRALSLPALRPAIAGLGVGQYQRASGIRHILR